MVLMSFQRCCKQILQEMIGLVIVLIKIGLAVNRLKDLLIVALWNHDKDGGVNFRVAPQNTTFNPFFNLIFRNTQLN